MSDHITDLFSAASEPGQNAAEALDSMLDYRLAKERKEGSGATDSLRLVGRVARLFTETDAGATKVQEKFDAAVQWWRAKKEQRADRRRAKNGSLDSVSFTDGAALSSIAEENPGGTVYFSEHAARSAAEPDLEPRSVLDGTGLYRSNVSENQPADELPLSDPEYDEVMAQAVARARAKLGEIPVAEMRQPGDEALIARLENAYGKPAVEPDRSQHQPRHTAPEDDQQLTSTNA